MTSQVIFKNNCKELPIVVSSWNKKAKAPVIVSEEFDKMYGITSYVDIHVPPNTEIVVESTVGEWMVNSILLGEENCKIWKRHGLSFESRMAKFSVTKYGTGKYIYKFCEDNFELVYEKGEGEEKDKYIWSYNGYSPPADIDEVD